MRLHSRTFSFLFLLVYYIAPALAFPNRFPHSINHSPGFVRSPSKGLPIPTIDASDSTTALSKRTLNRELFRIHYELGLGWFCYYNVLDMVRPVGDLPLHQMEYFFNTVLSLGGALWAHEPALNYREATMGEITLKLISSDPLPWDWIHDYLIGAVLWARTGVVARYKVTYRNELTGVWTIVELILPFRIDAAAAARRFLKP